MNNTTVIIPYRNNISALKRALDSVANQTRIVSVIIIDDCSQQEQLAENVICDYPSMDLTVITMAENVGGGVARNIGIENTKTKFIAFLDCDDYWKENKIEEQEKLFFDINDKKCIVYCDIEVVTMTGSNLKTYNSKNKVEDFSKYVFFDGGLIQTSSIFLLTETAKKCLFNPELKRHQDYDFCLKLQKEKNYFVGCNKTCSYWVVDDSPFAAIKKGYKIEDSIKFYQEYENMMSSIGGYAFLAKVPFWFSFKTKCTTRFLYLLIKSLGFRKVTMMLGTLFLLTLKFGKK